MQAGARTLYLVGKAKRIERIALFLKQLGDEGLTPKKISDRARANGVKKCSPRIVAYWKEGDPDVRAITGDTALELLAAFGVDPDFLTSDAHGINPHYRAFPVHRDTADPMLERWLVRMGRNVAPSVAEKMRGIRWAEHAAAMYLTVDENWFGEAWSRLQRIESERADKTTTRRAR